MKSITYQVGVLHPRRTLKNDRTPVLYQSNILDFNKLQDDYNWYGELGITQ
jgi:hypothetical protein